MQCGLLVPQHNSPGGLGMRLLDTRPARLQVGATAAVSARQYGHFINLRIRTFQMPELYTEEIASVTCYYTAVSPVPKLLGFPTSSNCIGQSQVSTEAEVKGSMYDNTNSRSKLSIHLAVQTRVRSKRVWSGPLSPSSQR